MYISISICTYTYTYIVCIRLYTGTDMIPISLARPRSGPLSRCLPWPKASLRSPGFFLVPLLEPQKSQAFFAGCWEYHGNIMGISWEYHGNVMGISWDSLWDVICFGVVFSVAKLLVPFSKSPMSLSGLW